jgi:hypothetical protein
LRRLRRLWLLWDAIAATNTAAHARKATDTKAGIMKDVRSIMIKPSGIMTDVPNGTVKTAVMKRSATRVMIMGMITGKIITGTNMDTGINMK